MTTAVKGTGDIDVIEEGNSEPENTSNKRSKTKMTVPLNTIGDIDVIEEGDNNSEHTVYAIPRKTVRSFL